MNILVLNASPRGDNSITLQSSLYAEKKLPQCSFSFINIGFSKSVNEKKLDEITAAIRNSDLTVFSFPVYTFIAPSQLHYFIRLLREKELSFEGKKATCITTSKHFYDTTAHKWLEENLLDLGFDYIEGLSEDMEDLTKKEGQEDLLRFWRRTLWAVENSIVKKAGKKKEISSLPEIEKETLSTEKKDDYTVSVVVDYTYNRERIGRMVENFVSVFPYRTRIVDLSAFTFRGGCLGCLRCALEGKCVYNDGFARLLEDEVLSSDAVVYAFSVTDHSMGPLYKNYDDRRFYNGHRTVSQFKPIGYIVDGILEGEDNLRTILEARSEVGRNYLSGMAENEEGIRMLSMNLAYALENSYRRPRNFYGVGGMKIFRDLIWVMRGIMRDDHRFYRKYGFYDFPQKEKGKMIALCFLGSLMRNKKIMAKNASAMDKGMLMPYKKVIEEA